MNEAEWLASVDPAAMLEWLRTSIRGVTYDNPTIDAGTPLVSDRKLRLFACACCRAVWHLLTDERSRKAIEVAERYADGVATKADLAQSHRNAWRRHREEWEASLGAGLTQGYYDSHWLIWVTFPDAIFAERLSEIIGGGNGSAQSALLRDIVGNPFRPVPILMWYCNGGEVTSTVLGLARTIYDDRDFALLPMLADALEDAGATDETLLRHLRGWERPPHEAVMAGATWYRLPGPHVRGCWALDLLLGLE